MNGCLSPEQLFLAFIFSLKPEIGKEKAILIILIDNFPPKWLSLMTNIKGFFPRCCCSLLWRWSQQQQQQRRRQQQPQQQ